VAFSNFFSSIASRVAAYRRRRQIRPARALGYREIIDLGIYRGHIDRVASAENEAI
jgi:uncharacterized protein YjiS (DUF1127 family)